jgi:hypothetical protein
MQQVHWLDFNKGILVKYYLMSKLIMNNNESRQTIVCTIKLAILVLFILFDNMSYFVLVYLYMEWKNSCIECTL